MDAYWRQHQVCASCGWRVGIKFSFLKFVLPTVDKYGFERRSRHKPNTLGARRFGQIVPQTIQTNWSIKFFAPGHVFAPQTNHMRVARIFLRFDKGYLEKSKIKKFFQRTRTISQRLTAVYFADKRFVVDAGRFRLTWTRRSTPTRWTNSFLNGRHRLFNYITVGQNRPAPNNVFMPAWGFV